jgi:hypothetical protein
VRNVPLSKGKGCWSLRELLSNPASINFHSKTDGVQRTSDQLQETFDSRLDYTEHDEENAQGLSTTWMKRTQGLQGLSTTS